MTGVPLRRQPDGGPGASDAVTAFVSSGHLYRTEVPGVFGYGRDFERLIHALEELLAEAASSPPPDQVYRFPPLLPRDTVERTGYLKSMPHLLGCVHAFGGSDEEYWRLADAVEAGRDWSYAAQPTDVVLAPAVCHNVYPLLRDCSRPVVVDARGECFRREATAELGRLQSFRMREFVCAGPADFVVRWRDCWIDRARTLLVGLGLHVYERTASDPFFAEAHRILRLSQEAERLKVEMHVNLHDDDHDGGGAGAALASINHHKEHFTSAFDIGPSDTGARWHTACVGFGMERLAMALFATHGLAFEQWPSDLCERLRLSNTGTPRARI